MLLLDDAIVAIVQRLQSGGEDLTALALSATLAGCVSPPYSYVEDESDEARLCQTYPQKPAEQ